jgi:transcriptional regulator with GAF, ATPase, and Fis domain
VEQGFPKVQTKTQQQTGFDNTPGVLWLRSPGGNEAAELFEKSTGIKVALHQSMPAGEELPESLRLVVIELPLAPPLVRQALSETQRTTLPMRIVLYDPESNLDECLIEPPLGAFRHITGHLQPVQLGEVVHAEFARAIEQDRVGTGSTDPWKDLLIGESRAMQLLNSMIRLIGPRRSTVLISGETGTGKEVVARAIHMASARSGTRMVAVNCAAIPENLFESELFGHVRGAFTGAVADRVGRFEQAHRGTLFLDEVGEVPIEIQPKLLRVLQEREVQRLGALNEIQIDTRVIAATNRDLHQAVAAGRFREDLLYRLDVVPIVVPPLRDRAGDIPLLAEHFVEKVCMREGISLKTISPDAVRWLTSYEWPGNVRQLEHTIEMAVLLSGARERLYAGDMRISGPTIAARPDVEEIRFPPVPGNPAGGINLEQMVVRVEQLMIQEALRQCGGNKAKAASLLGIPRTTLIYKMRAIEACA